MNDKPTQNLEYREKVETFFARPVCARAARPLKNGIRVSLEVDGQEYFTLTKENGILKAYCERATLPEVSFRLSKEALEALSEFKSEDIGEMGVLVLEWITHAEASKRITVASHVGILELVWKGYLGVLPLGGPAVMKFLAARGFSGLGKIKEAISHLRS